MIVVKSLFLVYSFSILFWVIIFLYINDFFVPNKSIKKFKKILTIYPHPDDEVLTVGGMMAKSGNATLLILTKGEKGTSDAHLDLKLKAIRSMEVEKSAKILRVAKLILKDFGDGQLENKKEELKKEIESVIVSEQPDLIVTYDRSGFYGHPDHIVVSEIITTLVKNKFKQVELWYNTIPQKVFKILSLPEQMAHDTDFKIKRTYPTHKVFVGGTVFQKISAMMAHKSQYHYFQDGIPIPIPSSFFHSMTLFEYFYKAN